MQYLYIPNSGTQLCLFTVYQLFVFSINTLLVYKNNGCPHNKLIAEVAFKKSFFTVVSFLCKSKGREMCLTQSARKIFFVIFIFVSWYVIFFHHTYSE